MNDFAEKIRQYYKEIGIEELKSPYFEDVQKIIKSLSWINKTIIFFPKGSGVYRGRKITIALGRYLGDINAESMNFRKKRFPRYFIITIEMNKEIGKRMNRIVEKDLLTYILNLVEKSKDTGIIEFDKKYVMIGYPWFAELFSPGIIQNFLDISLPLRKNFEMEFDKKTANFIIKASAISAEQARKVVEFMYLLIERIEIKSTALPNDSLKEGTNPKDMLYSIMKSRTTVALLIWATLVVFFLGSLLLSIILPMLNNS